MNSHHTHKQHPTEIQTTTLRRLSQSAWGKWAGLTLWERSMRSSCTRYMGGDVKNRIHIGEGSHRDQGELLKRTEAG